MPDIPGWALQTVDLHTTDEDELAALVDDACDNDASFMFVDSDDLENPEKPLAVLIPWERYVHMTALALAVPAKPHLPDKKDLVAGKVSPGEVPPLTEGDQLDGK